MAELPYVSRLRMVGEPTESAMEFVKSQERGHLWSLVTKHQKVPVGDVEVLPLEEEGPLPEGHHTFEFRLHYKRRGY